MPRLLTCIFTSTFLLSFPGAVPAEAGEACPPVATLQQSVTSVFKQDLTVESVAPGAVPGLCDVIVRHKGQRRVIYSDPGGNHLIAGQVFRVSDGANLTQLATSEMNRLTPEEMKTLSGLTAFSVGSKGPVVYFVTDPQCPYCQKAEAVLEPLAEKGELTVRFLLYPLSFHRGAREESISIICDKKGLEGLKNRHRSENQCEEGISKVDETVRILTAKGITGTPSYIFPDGLSHSGVLEETALRERMAGKKGEATK